MFRKPNLLPKQKKSRPKKAKAKAQSDLRLRYSPFTWFKLECMWSLSDEQWWVTHNKANFISKLTKLWRLTEVKSLEDPAKFIVDINLLEYMVLSQAVELEKSALAEKTFCERYLPPKLEILDFHKKRCNMRAGVGGRNMSWQIMPMPAKLRENMDALDTQYIVIDFVLDFNQRNRVVMLFNLYYAQNHELFAFHDVINENNSNIYFRADLFCQNVLPNLLILNELVDLKKIIELRGEKWRFRETNPIEGSRLKLIYSSWEWKSYTCIELLTEPMWWINNKEKAQDLFLTKLKKSWGLIDAILKMPTEIFITKANLLEHAI